MEEKETERERERERLGVRFVRRSGLRHAVQYEAGREKFVQIGVECVYPHTDDRKGPGRQHRPLLRAVHTLEHHRTLDRADLQARSLR
jgi:hypothetical protein